MLDVVAVPHRLQERVGEPHPEEVLHGRHAEDVVDAKHGLLASGSQRLG
ncbi:MAG TPA: hypothetical protein VNB88_01320 [Gaiellaceae bacterium]|nr:hypothetical protein [Gaiellaceae bacterium]